MSRFRALSLVALGLVALVGVLVGGFFGLPWRQVSPSPPEVHEPKSLALTIPRNRMAHGDSVLSVRFTPDGKTLVTGSSSDKTIKLWDVATGQERATLHGHPFRVDCLDVSRDGKLLISGGINLLRLWDLKTGKELATL